MDIKKVFGDEQPSDKATESGEGLLQRAKV